MPSKSLKQHKAMCVAAHVKGSKKGGISKKVAKEFCDKDKKSGKFKKGKRE